MKDNSFNDGGFVNISNEEFWSTLPIHNDDVVSKEQYENLIKATETIKNLDLLSKIDWNNFKIPIPDFEKIKIDILDKIENKYD